MTLHRKGDFADVAKLKVGRTEMRPGVSGLAPCNHKHSYKKEAGGSALIVDVMVEERGWSDTGKSHGAHQGRNAGGF